MTSFFPYKHYYKTWGNKEKSTGLMTASKLIPFYSKHILSKVKEPLFRTPKGISIQAFKIKHQNLLIINVHLINFTRLEAFKRQLNGLATLLESHKGPIVLAGDFNTWNKYRTSFLNKFTKSFHLKKAPFKRLDEFLKLDHLYFRGLKLIQVKQLDVQTSDHFPLFAGFSSKIGD